MRAVKQTWFIAVLTFFIGCGLVSAQTGSTTIAAREEATQSPTSLIDAANQYKASSKGLLAIQEDAITKAEAKFDELRVLVSEGLVARAELEDAEQRLTALREELQTTQKQIADSDNMIAEIQAEQELAKTLIARPVKLVSRQYGTFSTIALHPDSSEGRALINYLQGQGIPFLAFRNAVPGVATGPHIHTGSPSHRLS